MASSSTSSSASVGPKGAAQSCAGWRPILTILALSSHRAGANMIRPSMTAVCAQETVRSRRIAFSNKSRAEAPNHELTFVLDRSLGTDQREGSSSSGPTTTTTATTYRLRSGRRASARVAMSGHTTRSSAFGSVSCRGERPMDRLKKRSAGLASINNSTKWGHDTDLHPEAALDFSVRGS